MGRLPIFIFAVIVIVTGIVIASIAKRKARAAEREAAELSEDSGGGFGRSDNKARLLREADQAHMVGTIAKVSGLGLGSLMLFFSLLRIVSANTVAIPTNFGAIGKPVNPGIHLTAPWTEYHSFSTRIQESQRLSTTDEGDKASSDCVTVAASDGADACVDATIRFTIDRGRADELYRRYGSFDAITSKLVRREVESGLKVVYGQYKPEDAKSGAKLGIIERDSNKVLKQRLNRYGVTVDRVVLGRIQFTDPAVQQRIDDKIKARQESEKAVIEQKTALTRAETKRKEAEVNAKAKLINAQAEADANAKLAASLTPELLQKLYYEALGQGGKVIVTNGAQTPVIVDSSGN